MIFNMVKKVLISTVFNPEPTLLAATKVGPDRLILVINKIPNKEQEASIKLIQNSLGKVIDVKLMKVNVYDIVEVATKCVEVIDMQPKDDLIYINITSGRKTMGMGLMFAAFARHEHVKKIAYNTEEDQTTIYLPRLSFKLTESEKKVLDYIDSGKYDSISDLSKKIDISTAMLYRAIDDLKDKDLVDAENGLRLTDAGKIARL